MPHEPFKLVGTEFNEFIASILYNYSFIPGVHKSVKLIDEDRSMYGTFHREVSIVELDLSIMAIDTTVFSNIEGTIDYKFSITSTDLKSNNQN